MSKKKQRLIRIALEDYEAQVDQMYENLIFELSIALHLKEDTVRRALEKL